MNYDTIIVEMLTRIQALENKVKSLEEGRGDTTAKKQTNKNTMISTSDIRNYILNLKASAAEKGETTLVLTAKDIHGALRLKQRYPMVCNAMRQAMRQGDEIVYSPQSGYSSTLKIRYFLQ